MLQEPRMLHLFVPYFYAIMFSFNVIYIYLHTMLHKILVVDNFGGLGVHDRSAKGLSTIMCYPN